MEQPFIIRYEFVLADGSRPEFEVRLDPRTLKILAPLPDPAPEWTHLDRHRCGNCPLDPAQSPLCPAAAQLVDPVSRFAQTFSFTDAAINVSVPERQMSRSSTVQDGLSSLIGIYMTTSGCPVLAKLRPMVRFHLPFATSAETTFRASAMYLVGQYLRREKGQTPDWDLDGLAAIYREIGEVNHAFARRIRSAVPADASVNALVLLDLFAKVMPESIEEKLAELRGLYAAWD